MSKNECKIEELSKEIKEYRDHVSSCDSAGGDIDLIKQYLLIIDRAITELPRAVESATGNYPRLDGIGHVCSIKQYLFKLEGAVAMYKSGCESIVSEKEAELKKLKYDNGDEE